LAPSTTERTGIAGQDGFHGYSELPRVQFIEGDISPTPDVLIATLDAITNSTVTAELANGRTYVLSSAYTKSAHELNTHDGLTRVRWEGSSCTEF